MSYRAPELRVRHTVKLTDPAFAVVVGQVGFVFTEAVVFVRFVGDELARRRSCRFLLQPTQ